MKIEQIFIGNIRKCINYYDDELEKENAILIRFENGYYVDFEKFNSILDYIRIYRDNKKDGYCLGEFMMKSSPYGIDSLFVDEKSLKPVYTVTADKTFLLKKVIKRIK